MSFGYHCDLKLTLLETVQSQYESNGTKCIQCYIGGKDFIGGDLRDTKVFMEATGFRLYTHSCLRMNLGSGYQKNIDTLRVELKPVLATGGSTVVHIGSRNVGGVKGAGTLDNVISSLKVLGIKERLDDERSSSGDGSCGSDGVVGSVTVLKRQRWPLLLENAAGEGAKMGSDLADLSYLFGELEGEGVGFVLDTAHAFGAGLFDFESKESILEMFELIDENVGVGKLQLIHLNDSKIPFGGCNDRHENLGKGCIWEDSLESCGFLLRECKRRGVDVLLETPWEGIMEDYEKGCEMLREEDEADEEDDEKDD
jgi:deoxyribonuclease-4